MRFREGKEGEEKRRKDEGRQEMKREEREENSIWNCYILILNWIRILYCFLLVLVLVFDFVWVEWIMSV